MDRECANPECRAKITAAFGFTLARDMLAYQDGEISHGDIREFCGICILRFPDPASSWQPVNPLRVEDIKAWR